MVFHPKRNIIHQFIIQRKSRTFWIILLGIITNVFTIIIPISIGKYYQLVFNFEAHRMKILGVVPNTIWDTTPKFLMVFLLLLFGRFFFYFYYEYFLRNEGEIFIKKVKDYLFSHQLKIHNSVYKEKGIGKYLLRYSGDISSLKNLYLKGSISAIVDVVMVLFAVSWLYLLNSKGAIMVIGFSIIFYFCVRLLNIKVESYSLQKRNITSRQLSFVSRTLNSILGVTLFNKQNIEYKKYKKKSRAVMESAFKFNKWSILNSGFVSFIQYAILCTVLYVFYLDMERGNIQIHGSELISFILLYITILPVIKRLFLLERVYKLGNISLKKVNNIIEIETEKINDGKPLKVNNPRVAFENVIYKGFEAINFTSKKMAFDTLPLPKGIEEIDIISVISRMNDNYKGVIKINDCDIKSFSPKSLRNTIALCSKDIPLVGRTVYEAITEYRSVKIKENVNTFFLEIQSFFSNISKLNLNDKIGENGSKLTMAQYEILCLVRGVLSEKKIIIVGFFPVLETHDYNSFLNVLKRNKATIIKLTN